MVCLPPPGIVSTVISDWRGANTSGSKLKKSGKKEIDARMAMLAAKRKEEIGKLKSLRQAKLANKEDLQATDWTLQNSTQLPGFVHFHLDKPLEMLLPGEEKYYVDTTELPAAVQAESRGHPRRCCVEDKHGETRLQVSWSKKTPALHTVIDMGSCGWPSMFALYDNKRGSLNGTFDNDPPHRRHRHHINAYERVGLGNMFAEVHLVLVVGAAPHGRSGFFGAIGGAAKEFFVNCSIDAPIFVERYPYLAHVMQRGRRDPDFGSPEHMQKVFEWARACP